MQPASASNRLGRRAASRNPFTEGTLRTCSAGLFLEAKPESGFVWKPYEQKLGVQWQPHLS